LLCEALRAEEQGWLATFPATKPPPSPPPPPPMQPWLSQALFGLVGIVGRAADVLCVGGS
jgi:hypothetical protein